MRILARADVERALSMRDAIAAVKLAFAELATGSAQVPVRVAIPQEQTHGLTLVMPGYLARSDALAVKLVSVHQRNRERGLPLIHALVVVIDSATGRPLAAMDGGYLTALRTGAASGVATELLAREDAEVAAILGAGAQARTQLLAVCAVRRVKRAWVYAPRLQQVRSFIAEMQGQLRPPVELIMAQSPAQAVREADVICAATTSATPVFDGADLKPGAHVNGVGSFTPQMQEVDFTTLKRASKLVVDSREGALSEAGDLLIALAQGVIQMSDVYGELGELAAGLKAGRESAQEITYFKSVGNAAQDVAVSHAVYERALEDNLGVEVVL